MKTETKSWWECDLDDVTYESPVEGTLEVSHPTGTYEKAHKLTCVRRSKHDLVAIKENQEARKGTIFYA
jgi:hypothetical protein